MFLATQYDAPKQLDSRKAEMHLIGLSEKQW